ncbi:PREDICTED: coiled-coil domain-containing protein 150 [Tauraco erythrolophus]|uniref:coiled-coil domain-containing protein 150 n=1 Tax=Tauraco erythrolophus TaxID=121530 RepID=UPI000523DE4E|nr:PREDICTED: coiled-coil domain-containing protein 150 [Tauraco erythrolophus]
MARPTVVPTSVRATVPEAFMVLHLRMRVVEEQTSALVRDLEMLGADGQSRDRLRSKTLETPAGHPAISPVQARVAFVGENTLWKNCETLVNRMCRLESVVQTLKLNVFQLQTAKELNPEHAAQLEQRLNAIHEEHLQEMKIVQQEAMKLRQHLSSMKEAEEKAKEEVQRLRAALEITTASKMNVVVAAEELRNTNQKIRCRIQELTEQLSQEISLRESLEESQATVMCRVRDMETTVEAERKQVQILQQDCQELRKDVQLARARLQEEEERTAQLEQQCTQLKAELDSRNCIISQLGEEAENTQLSFSKQRKENLQLQSKMAALRETAEKVQVLNDHLSQQCSELSTTLQSVAMENAKLILDYQTMLKAEQEKTRKLQEQDSLPNAAPANVLGELQSVQHERAQLQRELEALRTEYGKYRQKASLAEEAATTQRQLLKCTVARLQGELETALQEKGSLLAEKEGLQQEIRTTANETIQERNKLEVEKTENELEMVSMKFTLQTLEEENKRLLDHLATLVHEQYVQQQVQQVLAELADSKNKLAYEKGKLQMAVQKLEEELLPMLLRYESNLGIILSWKTKEAKMASLQHQLDTAKDGNSKVTVVLEHVLASHKKMQAALGAVQTELGHKDTEISNLRKDKSQTEQKVQKLETELEHCQARLVAMGRQHSSQVETAFFCTNSHHHVFGVELRTFAFSECNVQKSLEESSSKWAEVSRANKELRQKVIELEKSLSSYREKLKSQRAQVRQCLAYKANTEKVKETESELRKMEAIKEEYQKKNYEQSQDIQKFVSELKSVQSEMQVLLKNQHEVQVQNRQLESQLEAERRQRQQLGNECQKLVKTVNYLKKYKEETEKKLKEASIESEQATASLEAAHRWFKRKFGSLQLEVVKSHQPKNPEESSSKKEEKKQEELPTDTSRDSRARTQHQEGPRELGRK